MDIREDCMLEIAGGIFIVALVYFVLAMIAQRAAENERWERRRDR
jgi:hypothetical protein